MEKTKPQIGHKLKNPYNKGFFVYKLSGMQGVDFGSLWSNNGDTWKGVDKSGDKS